MCTFMLSNMWSRQVQEELNVLCTLGHERTCLQSLGNQEDAGNYSFPTYISHLLELESVSFVQKYAEKYWKPLEDLHKKSWDIWRANRRTTL